MKDLKKIVLTIEFWKCSDKTKKEILEWVQDIIWLDESFLQWSWYNFVTNTRDLHYKVD